MKKLHQTNRTYTAYYSVENGTVSAVTLASSDCTATGLSCSIVDFPLS